MQFTLSKELYDKRPEDFGVSKEIVSYFKRKKLTNIKDIVNSQNELCKTAKGKEYYNTLKAQVVMTMLIKSGMVKNVH